MKCFKCLGRGHYANECLNKRNILIFDNGDYDSEKEIEDEDEVFNEEEIEDCEVATPFLGDLLVKRSLNSQCLKDEQQRENIFHTRVNVHGKTCFVIIDGGSCTNVASTLLVDRLGLETKRHP